MLRLKYPTSKVITFCYKYNVYYHNFSAYSREYGPPLWSSGQSSWLHIRRPGFDSRHYQKKIVVGLERGALSLVSTTDELLVKKSSGSCLEHREYGHVVTLTTWHPLSSKVDNHFADKGRSLGRCSSLADSDHGVFFYSMWAIRFVNKYINRP
jgi:hypothetical protein